SMGVEIHRSISVADIDGDKKLEVIPSTYAVNAVSALNGEDGSVLWSKALISGTMDIHDVSIADIDGDGCVELLVGTAEKVLYALDDSLNSANCGCMEVEEPSILDRGLRNAELKIIKDKIYLSVPNNYYTNILLTIYDLSGRLQNTLYQGTLSKGNYTFTPNIHKSGIYFVRLNTGNFKETKKFILIK
ncbi:MAG: T9SS type A sorting domain-containing protein, partial [bacterium]|nr:T9SS type A sorting domain-containing protein [bacterium]